MIRAKVTIERKNQKAVEKFAKSMKTGFGKSYVTVGVHEDAGSYPDGTPVAEVAIYNEFGTENAPERSFMRSTMKETQQRRKEWTRQALQKVIQGKIGETKALEMIGMRMQVAVQNKIKSNVPPPNAPSTRASKDRRGVAQRTLIDSGLMLRSITYKVHR